MIWKLCRNYSMQVLTATFIWNRCGARLWSEMRSFWQGKCIFKMLLASWNFYIVLKGSRSFSAQNLNYAGQRAAKLTAIKLWEWFDPGCSRTRADRFECGRGWKADFFLRPPTLTASNFDALWPTDPIFTILKDLNLLKRYFEY